LPQFIDLTKKFGQKEALIGRMFSLGNIGAIYQTKGDSDRAFKYQEEALKIDRQIENRKGESDDLHLIGRVT
jgi:tetratricopeptide (TPR) repeat protein